MTRRRIRSRGHPRRMVVSLGASLAAALGLAAGVSAAQAAPGIHVTHVAGASVPVQPCAALTSLFLPGLPGSDTATVSANEVAGGTQSFFRYYLAPGVGHCGAPGPGSIAPTNPMQQVIDWVENGQPPAALNASGSVNGQSVTRPLCPYPEPDAIYTGGDPTAAASYTCSSRRHFTNPFLLNGRRGSR